MWRRENSRPYIMCIITQLLSLLQLISRNSTLLIHDKELEIKLLITKHLTIRLTIVRFAAVIQKDDYPCLKVRRIAYSSKKTNIL
jgi:hypothetical protein